jgi:alpha-L-fucosidase
MFGPRPGDQPDEKAYLDYVRKQVTELLTRYGEIRAFFWDVNVAGFEDPSLNGMIRKLQPGAVINNRGPGPGDYSTPERHVPDGEPFQTPTEACQSMGRESWGYRKGEDYFSSKFLMQSIAKIMAMGGNYLLNVGPDQDGKFPPECREGLEKIGDWYKRVRKAFQDTIPCSYMVPSNQGHLGGTYGEYLLTRRRNTFYAVLPGEPSTTGLVMEGFHREPRAARLLNDGRGLGFTVDTVPWRWKELPCLRLTGLPVEENLPEPMVVELEFHA